MYELIAKSTIFKGLDLGETTHLLNLVPHQIKHFVKGEMVALAGEKLSSLLVLFEGSVRGEMIDFSGRTVKIEDIDAPETLASAFLFCESNEYPVNIVTNRAASLLFLPKASFLHLAKLNEQILLNFLRDVSNRSQQLADKIKFLTFQTIKGKFSQYILKISRKKGSLRFELPQSQGQIADLFGVTRPALARAIREMHQSGYICAQGKQIEILDRKQLIGLLK